MSMRLNFTALAIVGLAFPVVAQAQSVDPVQAFARCVVSGNAAGARDLLAQAPGSGKANAAARKLAEKKSACGARVAKSRLDPELIRGAIAEQLYLTNYAAAPAALTGAPQPFQGSGDSAQVLYDVSRCATTRDPVAADMLVRSARGSADEKSALQPVIAAVSACTPSGAKIGFNRVQLRGMIAEGLYRTRMGAAQ